MRRASAQSGRSRAAAGEPALWAIWANRAREMAARIKNDREVAIVAARLTDRQKKQIVIDYLETESVNAAAKRNGVSWRTANTAITESRDIQEKLEEKKEQNTLDMLAYMDSRKEQAQGVIDSYLAALADPEKLKGATLSQIATALGIIVDKFTNVTIATNIEIEDLRPLAEMIEPIESEKSKT